VEPNEGDDLDDSGFELWAMAKISAESITNPQEKAAYIKYLLGYTGD
jgi:hypothetical protein